MQTMRILEAILDEPMTDRERVRLERQLIELDRTSRPRTGQQDGERLRGRPETKNAS